jgi:hypothetical protein
MPSPWCSSFNDFKMGKKRVAETIFVRYGAQVVDSGLVKENLLMQRPRGDVILRWLDICEQAVNTIAFSTKGYWRLWGPLSEPVVSSVDTWADTWAEQQRSYLQWLRQTYGVGNRP